MSHYNMTIKHIVMCGGGYNGIYTMGVLDYLFEQNFFDIKNIKTIYGTSVGGFVGVLLCLKLPWSTILEYVIERPWDRDIVFSADMMFNMIPKKGILDSSYIELFFTKLLKAKNLSSDITLTEFYKFSNIHLYFFAVDVNTFKVVKLSHKSHHHSLRMSFGCARILQALCIVETKFFFTQTTSDSSSTLK